MDEVADAAVPIAVGLWEWGMRGRGVCGRWRCLGELEWALSEPLKEAVVEG